MPQPPTSVLVYKNDSLFFISSAREQNDAYLKIKRREDKQAHQIEVRGIAI
jgi:hypothetical protein